MVELKGSLSGIGLPAIVQLIGELHHSGSLELFKGAARGTLDFDDGRLVAAGFGAEAGFQALAALSLEIGDGEFTFVERPIVHDRTLDLGPKDVQTYLRRVASGEDIALAAAPPAVEDNGLPSLGTCPLLGFADDQARHYSRATALHRCFATGTPSLVTGQEQRELCFGGRYPTCPRYRNASSAVLTGADSTVAESAPSPDGEPPLEFTPPSPAGEPSATAVPPQAMPAGVAARMAVANGMHLTDGSADNNASTTNGSRQPTLSEPREYVPAGRRLRRALLLVGSGVVVGLLLLVGVVLVSLPYWNGGLSTQRPSVAGVQSFAPAPAPAVSRVPAVDTAPAAAAPTTVSAPTAVARPFTPTAAAATSVPQAQSKPTAGSIGRTLLDVRFATGAPSGWLDNPPFVTWADGAIRLQAQKATRFVAVGAPVDQLLSDVVVSATFRKTGGPPGGGYGLVVRDQGPDPRDGLNQTMNAYVLEAGDLGEFGIWRRDGDHWVDLVPWTRSAAVRPGGSPNDLVVRATGDKLTFLINGTQVATVQDDTLLAGGVGVFIGGDYNEVALDRFTVQIPD